jgi:ankyrin repeat protein
MEGMTMGDSTLMDAVRSGDIAEAERQLRAGADVNGNGPEQGWTALNYAAGRGDVNMIRLLLDHGADLARTGKDERTPYMIALAAGRVDAARLLRDVEREKGLVIEAHHVERPYCKAYYLKDLRAYPGWQEQKINWEDGRYDDPDEDRPPKARLDDDDVVFLHHDYTVTELVGRNENVLFNDVTDAWKIFCHETLGFRVPDDFDLILPDHEMEKALAEQEGETALTS